MAEDRTGGGRAGGPPASRERDISRRDFVKRAGATTAAVALVGLGLPGVIKGAAFPHMAEAGVIMPDPGLCIGCLSCEVACSDVHREIGLSEVPRIRIYFDEAVEVEPAIVEAYGDRGSFMQAPCVQCPDAPCLPVCPVDALHVEPKTGARVINESTCIACGKCEDACIFPTIDEARATGEERFGQRSRITYDETKNVYAKCDLCYFRPEGPACIERCPVNIRINQGIIQSDVLCLDLATANRDTFERMREQQTVAPGGESPA